jgi:hypothetical protein
MRIISKFYKNCRYEIMLNLKKLTGDEAGTVKITPKSN